MKKIILMLFISSNLFAGNFVTTYNPFTRQQDYYKEDVSSATYARTIASQTYYYFSADTYLQFSSPYVYLYIAGNLIASWVAVLAGGNVYYNGEQVYYNGVAVTKN